jgi:hypothetical protein
MAQMAIRAMRVIARALMIPIANDAGGEDQQHDERQRNPEYPNRLPHSRAVIHMQFSTVPEGSALSSMAGGCRPNENGRVRYPLLRPGQAQ